MIWWCEDMICEYNNCDKEAYKKFSGLIWLCRKHYLIVLDSFYPAGAGRPRKIKFEHIFKWLGKGKEYITLAEFRKEFLITYPTANFYLNFLERQGFIRKEEKKWRVLK
jgi:hypothetical protein